VLGVVLDAKIPAGFVPGFGLSLVVSAKIRQISLCAESF
jgi:hypothetical protein